MGQMLNLFWEKTPENVFYECCLEASESIGAKLVDYTATEDAFLANVAGGEALFFSP